MILHGVVFMIFLLIDTAAMVLGLRQPAMYLPLLSLASLALFHFLLMNRKKTFYLSCGILCFSILLYCVRVSWSQGIGYLWGLAALIAGFIYYRMNWRAKLALLEEESARSQAHVSELHRKMEEKKQSLRGINRQLEDITRLFELAKDLNECLSFQGVAKVLRDKIFDETVFSRAVLLIFAAEAATPSVVHRIAIYEEGRIEESPPEGDLSVFEKRLVLEMAKNKKSIRINSIAEVPANWEPQANLKFPLRIFPLSVQGKNIALFLVEGAAGEDDARFEVVVSQLSLQVKKIKLYETVRELSIVDGLTQVFVRRHFIERFEDELRRTLRHEYHLSVLMLDIDHFKTYNDNYGHLVGDMTLRKVAAIIRSAVRRVDIVSRYGGEEFAIVLPETDKKGAAEVAERIRSSVAKTQFKVYDEETKVTVSIGLSTFPEDLPEDLRRNFRSDTLLELLKKADFALYQAKEEGRNRVMPYDPEKSS